MYKAKGQCAGAGRRAVGRLAKAMERWTMTVLVIDDEYLIVAGLISMINNFCFPNLTVMGFSDPAEACQYVTGNSVDVVLTDINMPGINGLDLISALKEQNGKCKFIILSGYQEFKYAQKAIKLEVVEYLIKPVDEADLHKILRRLYKGCYHVYPEEYSEMMLVDMETYVKDRSGYSRKIQMILEYIDRHFNSDISLTKLSEISGLHPKYLSTLFAKELNMNYLKYINGLRLNKALQMLGEDLDIPISTLALSLGYSSERQFYRMFKHLMSITPNEYREKIAEDIKGTRKN